MTRLEYLRRRRAWSQTVLAYHSGMGQGDVSRIERRMAIPTARVVERLALALDVDAQGLLEDVPAEAVMEAISR